MGNCLFKTGYCLYSQTCIGRCLHQRYVDSFKKQFGENAIHSKLVPFQIGERGELIVLPIPVLVNNYAYMVSDRVKNNFVIVDVGDATMIKKLSQKPDAILTTHKHWDHSGGNREMRQSFPGLKVYGGSLDHVPDATHTVEDGEELVFNRLKFTAIWTPGHTKGHIVWRLSGQPFDAPDMIFSGDHLMTAGCGAAFEGPVSQLLTSLDLMKNLPKDTLVWPGHEVGAENLELASYIEPLNFYAMFKMIWAMNRREHSLCTCPTTIEEELHFNPFLRTTNTEMLTALDLVNYIEAHSPPLSQEQIGVLSFDHILYRAGLLRRQKRLLKQRKAEERNQDVVAGIAGRNTPPEEPSDKKENKEIKEEAAKTVDAKKDTEDDIVAPKDPNFKKMTVFKAVFIANEPAGELTPEKFGIKEDDKFYQAMMECNEMCKPAVCPRCSQIHSHQ